MYSTSMLELAGDSRLELNCSFALCKEVCIIQAMSHSFDKRKDKKEYHVKNCEDNENELQK